MKLRPVRDDDEPFLRALRSQVDAERLGLQFWSPEDEALASKIVDLQFSAHAAHYRHIKSEWDTKDCIIEVDGLSVGRFIVTQDARVIFLADIVVDRGHRGKGLGQAVIDGIKGECVQSRRILRLHVDRTNPAVQFYLQLGFRVVEQRPLQFVMEWTPPNLLGKTQIFTPRG